MHHNALAHARRAGVEVEEAYRVLEGGAEVNQLIVRPRLYTTAEVNKLLSRERRITRIDAAVSLVFTLCMGFAYAQIARKMGFQSLSIGGIAITAQLFTFAFGMWMRPGDLVRRWK